MTEVGREENSNRKSMPMPEMYSEKLGTVLCSHQQSSLFFFCTMRINKHFCKTYPFAIPECKRKEMVYGHEHRDPSVPRTGV